MLKKVRFILVFISLSICLCLMSNTYSRYVAEASGNIDVEFAKWQIFVNNTDITTGGSSTINFEPVIEENENVKANKMAPSSTGYFDIAIDARNVDVSFNYDIELGIANENMPDLVISKYAILPNNYVTGDPLNLVNIQDGKISNSLNYDNNNPTFQYEPFTIRIFFAWYEGEGEGMNDAADTAAGNAGGNFTMNATVKFEQAL